jgi:hypothetical protein
MQPLRLEVRANGPEWAAEVPGIPGTSGRAPDRQRAIDKAMARVLRAFAEAIDRRDVGEELASDCLFAIVDLAGDGGDGGDRGIPDPLSTGRGEI